MKKILIALSALIAMQGCSISINTSSSETVSDEKLAAVKICGAGYTIKNGHVIPSVYDLVLEKNIPEKESLALLTDYYQCVDNFEKKLTENK